MDHTCGFSNQESLVEVPLCLVIFLCSYINSYKKIFRKTNSGCIRSYDFRLFSVCSLQGSTPRLVYKWFLLTYKISYFVGIFGYLTMMATFLGFNLIFNVKPSTWMDLGLLCMFYALYYGVMARDFAEICTEKMAANIGYYTTEGIPYRQLETDITAGLF